MFNPIKAIKDEIALNVAIFRVFNDEYKREKEILASKAQLEQTTHVPGYTNIYA